MTEKKVTLKLIKSMIGASDRQIGTLRALGLRRMQQEVECVETPQIRGMINKVQRWVAEK